MSLEHNFDKTSQILTKKEVNKIVDNALRLTILERLQEALHLNFNRNSSGKI